MEIWKEIVGVVSKTGITYEISDKGRVRRSLNKTYLTLQLMNNGYYQVTLRDGKEPRGYRMWLVHRLVALAFIPNPDNHETVDHVDYDCLNNTKENLQWVSRSYNSTYKKNSRLSR